MPPQFLPSKMPFKSACYFTTTSGVRKLQQQRLSVFTKIGRTTATTIMLQMFYNPYCKTIEDFAFAFPQKRGTRIKEVYCQIGELAWKLPAERSAAPRNILRTYRLLNTIQPKQKLVVRTTIEEKVEYIPDMDAYSWTLPMFMAPPYSSSLPLAYDDLTVEIKVDFGKPWKISTIESPSHGPVASNGGWIRMIKDELVGHKASASFRSKDPQLKKDIDLLILAKQQPPRPAREGPSPLSLYRRDRAIADNVNLPKHSTETDGFGGSISKDGDQNESTRNQTSNSRDSNFSQTPPSGADRLLPYSPPLTSSTSSTPSIPKCSLSRCSAPSPELPDPKIPLDNVRRLLALQQPCDCFNGHKTGFWTLHRALPEILSIPLSTLDSHPDLIKSRVWVTIVVLAWFEIIAQEHRNSWLEYVQRARNWLEFMRATGAVKFDGWEVKATNILISDEYMDD